MMLSPSRPLPGMMLWHDATQTPTGAVSSWTDFSGNGYHSTQGTGAAQPTCTANQQNGKNTILLDGGDALNFNSAMYALPNADNTCFVVSKRNTETGSAEYDWSFTEAGSVRHYSRFSATTGNNLYLNNTATTGGVSNTGSTNTNYVIKAMYKSGTTLAESVNNNTFVTNTNGANEPGIDAGTIGSLAGTGFLTGGIGEIIMYSGVLSTNQIYNNVFYLAKKWGITIA